MLRTVLTATLVALGSASASAQIFISEVFNNPPGSTDTTREYVELQGTPGMKLDGFAFAVANGVDSSYYLPGAIPPVPTPAPEIDELFCLDGLTLGDNGLLVIAIASQNNYPTVLPDTNFAEWINLENGLAQGSAGKMQNDGSNTYLLLRRRPGATPQDPSNPKGFVWRKAALQDYELVPSVIDPDTGLLADRFGDGELDEGQPDNITPNGLTNDMHGITGGGTFLEIVDEVSYEANAGLEYETDDRRVDVGSSGQPRPERKVHALDDPQGFTPDAVTRVDHRVKGPGWAPAPGSVGQLPNGNNWQDTATEQWIRGETVDIGGASYYDIQVNVDPNALQPYMTHVPLWLANGQAPDFAFANATGYKLEAGRLNQFAHVFVPGDVDRDGDCDVDDVAKVRGVFGNEDWNFGNSHPLAPESDVGDPTTQTRPWDVDGTGDNGIEPNDLQWVLNFQGDTTGRIVGRTYDSPVPSATGVHLNPNAGTTATFSAVATASCGGSLSALRVGDAVELIVSGEVTSGANTLAGEQNGIQQFTHDLVLQAGGVLAVETIDLLGGFDVTRAELMQPYVGGSGVEAIHGFTTDFTRGLGSAAPLYRVVLRAVGAGNETVIVTTSSRGNFAASTPFGAKLGHTLQHGDPATAQYPTPIAVSVAPFSGAGFVKPYGIGCVGTGGFVPRLRGTGCATPGGSVTLTIENGQPGNPGFLFVGIGALAATVVPGCSIQVLPLATPSPISLPGLFGSVPGSGELTLPGLPIPAIAPIGISVNLQVFFADATNFVSGTNPLELSIGS